MKRIAIVLEKNLDIGAAANVSAILMGQASLMDVDLYSESYVKDKNNVRHAAIKYSTVILKAGENQLLNLAKSLQDNTGELNYVVFSKTGQLLNNAFDH